MKKDSNKDGAVTKDEYSQWVKQEIENWRQNMNRWNN